METTFSDGLLLWIEIENTYVRHSRAGGNLGPDLSEIFSYFKLLDSRLRGNDGIGTFPLNLPYTRF